MSMFYGISSDSVSTLFSNLGTAKKSSDASGSVLGQYMAIQNGSYYKLARAYYEKTEKAEAATDKDTAKELTSIRSNADDLADAASVLLERGTKSLFKEETEDREALYDALDDFVKDYNTLIDASKDANSTSILTAASSMVTGAKTNEALLKRVGIEIAGDNKLSINEDVFKEAKWSDLTTLFQGHGSFAYSVKANAMYMSITAAKAASKTTTYTRFGYKSDFEYSSVMDDII